MKHRELNIMSNVKIIESLKAELVCIIGEFFKLLTKGNNVAQEAILECISGGIMIFYILGRKLWYSLPEIDHVMKKKLESGIKAEDDIERESKSLSELRNYISNRREWSY